MADPVGYIPTQLSVGFELQDYGHKIPERFRLVMYDADGRLMTSVRLDDKEMNTLVLHITKLRFEERK